MAIETGVARSPYLIALMRERVHERERMFAGRLGQSRGRAACPVDQHRTSGSAQPRHTVHLLMSKVWTADPVLAVRTQARSGPPSRSAQDRRPPSDRAAAFAGASDHRSIGPERQSVARERSGPAMLAFRREQLETIAR